jgi:signal transduction histidine kinase
VPPDSQGTALADAQALAGRVDMEFLETEVPEAILQTLNGIDRVATIVRAMKAFGHPSGEERTPADINAAIRNTLVVANNEVKYVATVVTELDDLPLVPCFLGDVNQVLLNLVVNAAHAIRAADRPTLGTITVRTRTEGQWAVIDVQDDGTGIPPEVAERVFEPFFTTKGVGVGTGQGLTLSYGLVTERHGGTLTFDTTPGRGTTFRVRLPLTSRETELVA